MDLLVANLTQSAGCRLFLTPEPCIADTITRLTPVEITADAQTATVNMPHTIVGGAETLMLPAPTASALGDRIQVHNASLDTVQINYTDATSGNTVIVYCIPPGGTATFRVINSATAAEWLVE